MREEQSLGSAPASRERLTLCLCYSTSEINEAKNLVEATSTLKLDPVDEADGIYRHLRYKRTQMLISATQIMPRLYMAQDGPRRTSRATRCLCVRQLHAMAAMLIDVRTRRCHLRSRTG